jgi:hypothetical protein
LLGESHNWVCRALCRDGLALVAFWVPGVLIRLDRQRHGLSCQLETEPLGGPLEVTEVDTVALWVGIITGIASTVLALVAIWFTFVVNQRSTQVSDQTIRSLEAIESAVKRQSTDTNDLIQG